MMSRRTLGVLAGALVVLAAVSWLTSRQRYGAAEGGGFEDVIAGDVDPGAVQTVRAWVGAFPDSAVELARRGDAWVVPSSGGWAAKKDLVDKLLEDVKGLRGELRSSSADVLADYRIDDENGMHLVGLGSGGGELFHVIVGKTALRGGGFVRRQGSDDVFLTPASLRSSFGLWGDEPKAPDAKRWLELRVTQLDRQDVDRIVLRDGPSEIVLEKTFPSTVPDTTAAGPSLEVPDRTDWTWKPDASGEFDKRKADTVLGTLCNLYASDVVPAEGAEGYGLGEGARVAEVFLADGTKVTARFGNALEEEKKTYLRVDDGLPGKIYQSTADRIFPKRSELKPDAS